MIKAAMVKGDATIEQEQQGLVYHSGLYALTNVQSGQRLRELIGDRYGNQHARQQFGADSTTKMPVGIQQSPQST